MKNAKDLINSDFIFHPMTLDFIQTTNDKNELVLLGIFFEKYCVTSDAYMKTLKFKIFKRLFEREHYRETIRDNWFADVCLSECRKKISGLKKFSKNTKNQ